ncbi:MAG: amidohydrolase [Candidatus Binataceae bacterium]|nr:amidohydrolase [Candidatus Binataceae bacterium]
MTKPNYPLIDCDGHIVESISELKEFMDPAIRVFAEPNRAFAHSITVFPTLDGIHHLFGFANNPIERPAQAANGHRVGSGEDWSALLDHVGLKHSVLFTSDGLAIGTQRARDYTNRLCRAYNDYVAERFKKVDSRLHPMALIPMQFPADAAIELRRAVKDLGLPGAMITSTGLPLPVGNEYFWPVYKEAADLDCPLAFHGGSNRGLGLDNVNSFVASHVVHHPVALMYAFLTLAYEGAIERFPNTRFAFLEGGVEWVMLVLERIKRDQTFFHANSVRHLFENGRILVGCEGNDYSIRYLAKDIGVQFLAFSSDYPHEAGVEAVEHEIEETMEEPALSDDEKAAILGGNARRFYRL